MISFIHIAKITIQSAEIEASNNTIGCKKKYPNVSEVVKNLLYFASEEASNRTTFQIKTEQLFQALMERENQQSTELGLSIAIPHGRLSDIETPIVSFYVLEKPIQFNQEMVKIVPVLWIPEQQPELHLAYLSELVTHLSNEEKHDKILSCKTDEQLKKVIEEFYK